MTSKEVEQTHIVHRAFKLAASRVNGRRITGTQKKRQLWIYNAFDKLKLDAEFHNGFKVNWASAGLQYPREFVSPATQGVCEDWVDIGRKVVYLPDRPGGISVFEMAHVFAHMMTDPYHNHHHTAVFAKNALHCLQVIVGMPQRNILRDAYKTHGVKYIYWSTPPLAIGGQAKPLTIKQNKPSTTKKNIHTEARKKMLIEMLKSLQDD